MKNLKAHYLYIILIFASIIIAYHQLPWSYFEQDEWHSFGYYNYLLSLPAPDFIKAILGSNPLNHFTPLSLFLKMGLYWMAGLNAAFYFFASIFLHILTALSVYFLIFFLLKKRWPAFLGSLFFAVNSSHHQAVTWIGTFEGTEGAVLFGIASLILLLLHFRERKVKFFYLSLLALFSALLFKETALTFVLVVGGLLLFTPQKKLDIRKLFGLGITLVIYVSTRSAYLLFGVQSSTVLVSQTTKNLPSVFFYNLITSPVKIFTQILFPNDLLVELTNKMSTPLGIYAGFAWGPWVQENAFRYDLAAIPLGLMVLFLLVRFLKNVLNRQAFYLGVSLIVLTIVPFLTLKKYLTYLDSRYFYPASVGLALILALVVDHCSKKKKGRPIYLFISAFLIFHLGVLLNTIDQQVEIGRMRQSIVKQITQKYPRLPEKALFYTESDRSYYGLPDNEKILPFQSGFGQLLLVEYYPTGDLPAGFFKNDFLWDINSQGYQEIAGKGFGYIRNFTLLKKVVIDYNIPADSVMAFSWHDETGTLADISKEVRNKLSNNLP